MAVLVEFHAVESQQPDESAMYVKAELQQGSARIGSSQENVSIELLTETGIVHMKGPSGVEVLQSPAADQMRLEVLSGSAVLTPTNPALVPIVMTEGERVAVAEGTITPLPPLSRLYIPSLSRN